MSICNRSDIIVQFKWSNFATLREELQQKDRFSKFSQLAKHTRSILLNGHLVILVDSLKILPFSSSLCIKASF